MPSRPKTEAAHTPDRWTVDDCPDANWFWTIRLDDGTLNGNTDKQSIATVYTTEAAAAIVRDHNAAPALADLFHQCLDQWRRDFKTLVAAENPADDELYKRTALARRARAALTAAGVPA